MLKNVTFTPQPYPSWNLLIQPQSADMPKRLQFFGIHSLHYPVTCHLVLGEAQGRWFDMSTSRLMVLPNSFVNISSGKPTFSQSFSSLKMLKFRSKFIIPTPLQMKDLYNLQNTHAEFNPAPPSCPRRSWPIPKR